MHEMETSHLSDQPADGGGFGGLLTFCIDNIPVIDEAEI